MTPNASGLGPMIPAMEHRFFSTLTIAVVAGVTLLVVLLGLWQVLMLIVSYGD
jgi:cytochrome oxidase assembly protein ShyY1